MTLSNEVKVGIIVVTALVSLVWGINYLKGTDVLSNRNEYFAIYNDVANLSVSNTVKLNGIRVGFVSEMKFVSDNSGRVLVSILIDDNIFVPKNSTAKIIDEDLLGAKAIRLVRSKETEAAVDGDTLRAKTSLGLSEELGQQVEPFKHKAEKLMMSLDTLASVMAELFNEKNRESLSGTFENLDNMTSDRGQISKILKNLEELTASLNSNSEKINKVVDNLTAVSDSLAAANIVGTLNNANASLQQMHEILDKINKGEGTMGMLVNNDSLYRRLTKSSEDLDKLLIDMKENPKRYVHFSLFGKKAK